MYQTMVREIDSTWNPLLESIEILFHKLVGLGFTNVDGEIVVVKVVELS